MTGSTVVRSLVYTTGNTTSARLLPLSKTVLRKSNNNSLSIGCYAPLPGLSLSTFSSLGQ